MAAPVRDAFSRAPWATFLVVALLTYGSTYPFRFRFPPPDSEWTQLLALRVSDLYLGDVLANFLLFLPLGFLLALPVGSKLAGIARACGLGLLLGLALQLFQVLLPDRVPSLWDALWNGAGASAGALLPAALGGMFRGAARPAPFAIGLILLWIAAETFPFVPTTDWQTLKDGLKPLLLEPAVQARSMASHCLGWMAVAFLWRTRSGLARPGYGPWLALAGVLAAQVVIVEQTLTASEVLGGLAGIPLARLLPPGRLGAGVLAVLTMSLLVWDGLAPFRWQEASAAFHWLPLHGFLQSSTFLALGVGLAKLFWYGLLAELMLAATARPGPSIGLGAGFLAAIEAAQPGIPGHVAEITDPLLFAALAGIRAAGLRRGPPQGLADQMGGQQPEGHAQEVGTEVKQATGGPG